MRNEEDEAETKFGIVWYSYWGFHMWVWAASPSPRMPVKKLVFFQDFCRQSFGASQPEKTAHCELVVMALQPTLP